MQTQWRVGWSVVGLDYPAMLSVATIHGIEVTPEMFAKIQALEFDTLKAQADKPS